MVKVAEITPYMRQMRSRMPFRFGKTVMTGMPVLHLRMRLEDEQGRSFEGCSACGLVSMWFDKDYSKSEVRREADLLYSVGEAVKAYLAAGAGTAWQLHAAVEPVVRRKLKAEGLTGLVAGYGIALVDAAIIDGVCRRAGLSFFDGLKAGVLGFDEALARLLPAAPSPRMALRHTVGLGDPLVAADVTEPRNDGLPQTLEQVIAAYGARYFKIKVNNDVPASLERLHRVAQVLDAQAGEYKATLDGNEAFPTMEEFRGFVEACAAAPGLERLWSRTLWIEQPVARQQALNDSIAGVLAKINERKPVIIDESDDEDAVLDRALKLGYHGISAKNCKGIFRTLHSYLAVKQAPADAGLVLSSEDLTNQPIVPNHQDLCVAAALGITHSERNGHHFFRGFEFLPEGERAQALRDYPALYEMKKDGYPSLRFRDGELAIAEINNASGVGVVSSPEWSSMEVISLPQQPPAIK